MGVDCSNVDESIHLGAPKSIEAYVQESGRTGRNGCSSISRILYNAMLLRGADHYMKTYIKETACRRHNLMRNFGNYAEQEINGYQCCDNCAKSCSCSLSCNNWVVMNTATIKQPTATQPLRTRNVCSEQKKQLYELRHEYRKKLTQEKTVSLLGVQTEFYSFHISQVLNNCQHLFTLDDIYRYVEIWRKVYALNILCILRKVFCDIVVNTDSLNLFDLDQSMDSLPDEWLSIRDDSQAEEFALWDSYMLQSSAECSQITVEDDNESVEQPLDQDSFTE